MRRLPSRANPLKASAVQLCQQFRILLLGCLTTLYGVGYSDASVLDEFFTRVVLFCKFFDANLFPVQGGMILDGRAYELLVSANHSGRGN